MDKRFFLKAKKVENKDDLNYFIHLNPDEINRQFLIKNFTDTSEGNSKYKPWDYFTLPANACFNKTAVETTLGCLIFNKFVYLNFLKVIGYQNYEFYDDNIRKVDDILSTLVNESVYTTDDYIDYSDRINWFGFVCASLFSTSLSYDIFAPIPAVVKRKEELLSKHSQEIENGDAFVTSKIETELLDLSKSELKGHASYDNFANGVGKFGNAYKNMTIMRGSIADLKNPGKYTIAPESYLDGFSKENFPYFVNMNINGAYSKAVGTRVGGYQTKKFFNAFQTVVLDEHGTDCGTTVCTKIKIIPEIQKWIMYRYIKDGNKLVMLTPDNYKNYLGKTVEMRSPQYCQTESICNKCAGEYYYMLGIKNVGLLLTKGPNSILMIEMKAFHDQTIKLNKLRWQDYIIN